MTHDTPTKIHRDEDHIERSGFRNRLSASHHRPGVASARFREPPKWRESTTDGIVSIK
jgi:hypothetical protein